MLKFRKMVCRGVRYPCDKFEYAATNLVNLKQQIESKHEGVRYPCDKCKYTTTTASNLKRHIVSKH